MTALAHDLESMAALLDESGDYRVLRKFRPRDRYCERVPIDGVEPPAPVRGLFIDVETTGLGADDKIIEFAAVPFEFSHDGLVFDVGLPFTAYEDPGIPIPATITQLTGIMDDDVRGQRIDDALVAELFANADLVIAHNATFDRPRVEARFPAAAGTHWACSRSEVPWDQCGIGAGTKLEWLLYALAGEFTADAHAAASDALVGIHLLATVRIDGRPAMAHLRDAARQPIYRVWAEGAPFHAKDALKARGYHGHYDGPKFRAWRIDLPAEKVADERAWMWEACGIQPRVAKLTAKERYSVRAER